MDCGSCTVCCTFLPIVSLGKYAGIKCVHCQDNCIIYEKRPEECVKFRCAYSQMDKVSLKLRPDKCGTVFEKPVDNVFWGTHAGTITEIAKAQINAFLIQGFKVVTKDIKNQCITHHKV